MVELSSLVPDKPVALGIPRSNRILKVLVLAEGLKLENPEKTLRARTRTNNKLDPHMTPGPGIEPGPGERALSPLHHPCYFFVPVVVYLQHCHLQEKGL